jgi:sarcosine oxidase subunit gamma
MVERTTPIDLAQVDVRVDDPAALPFEPPAPNATTTWGDRDVLWLGPDEWLVVGAPWTEREIVDDLETLLDGHHRSVVDVSANRTAIDVTDALELLSSECGLDLDPTRWGPGMCAQTLFGPVPVLLQQRDERTTRVFVRPSYAAHFLKRLAWWVAITS